MSANQKLAWVAGAKGGIGHACVTKLIGRGFEVHGSDLPEEDLTAATVVETVTEKLRGRGGIDAAVFAVGMSGRSLGDGKLSECSDESWHTLMDVNLTAAFRFLRSCLKVANDGASVVVIGSALSGRIDPDFHTAAYKVSKAALHPLVELAAFEGAGRGIRVNLVNPGLVDTAMAKRALGNSDIQQRFSELMPLTSRPAPAEKVAEAVDWLVCSESTHTTGTIIQVDGGWLL